MLTIVVGGFFGDEGKGKIVGYLSRRDKPKLVVRAGGGPQAGHTVVPGKAVTQIPSGFVNRSSRLLVARGTVVDPHVILEEIAKYKVADRIGIDFGCTIIEHRHILQEQVQLKDRIGSVGTGTGPARRDRVMRWAKLAKDIPSLAPYICDVAEEVNASFGYGDVLVEGVQGYGLSLLDHRYYPYVTSQDTTASQFAADVGIGPKAVDEIIVVFKSYVSRVAQGVMKNEWSEEEKKKRGIEERGTVSGRIRRLGNFDVVMAQEALLRNTATTIALTAIDRLYPGNTGVRDIQKLTQDALDFYRVLNTMLSVPQKGSGRIRLVSTGPNLRDIIDMR